MIAVESKQRLSTLDQPFAEYPMLQVCAGLIKLDLYNFHTVSKPSVGGPLALGILPPLHPTGGIVGLQAWEAAYQQFKIA